MMDIPRAAMNFRYFANVISEKKDDDIDRVAHQNDLISIARRVPVGVAGKGQDIISDHLMASKISNDL